TANSGKSAVYSFLLIAIISLLLAARPVGRTVDAIWLWSAHLLRERALQGPFFLLCSLLWHAERLVWPSLWPAPSLPAASATREGLGARWSAAWSGGASLPGELWSGSWVAALLLVDFDDLVGRGELLAPA